MQPILRELLVWMIQFLCVSSGLLLSVHLIARRMRHKAANINEKGT